MTDIPAPPIPPQAVTRRTRRLSVIWLVPLVAFAIGAWLAWDTLSKEGPTIGVTFESAQGLQAGQSQLNYRTSFGNRQESRTDAGQFAAVVTIATTRQAKLLMTEKTVFWVVKPHFFAGQISGFETVLSAATSRASAADSSL